VASLDDLEQRLAAVEERIGLEAGLRASQDRDLSSLKVELRSTNNLLQALALTQSRQTRTLTGLEATASEHGDRLSRVEDGVRQILALLGQPAEQDGRPRADK